MSDQPSSEKNFESALARLELILEKMHAGNVPLEDALKLYEEANRLILFCNKQLHEAEEKIEVLIKNRNGDVSLGPNGKPQTQPFHPMNGK